MSKPNKPKNIATKNIVQFIVQLRGVSKHYSTRGNNLVILNNIDLSIPRGKVIAIVGASGSGKSTLLNIMGGLDKPTDGDIIIDGTDIATTSENSLTEYRSKHIGFVFQRHHLLRDFTVLENVLLPQYVQKTPEQQARLRTQNLLESVGLSNRQDHIAAELSGGELQRVAIARAMSTKPSVVLADEPTGNLDEQNSQTIFDLLLGLVRKEGTTVVMVTHSGELASQCDAIYQLEDGKLQLRSPSEV